MRVAAVPEGGQTAREAQLTAELKAAQQRIVDLEAARRAADRAGERAGLASADVPAVPVIEGDRKFQVPGAGESVDFAARLEGQMREQMRLLAREARAEREARALELRALEEGVAAEQERSREGTQPFRRSVFSCQPELDPPGLEGMT